MPCLHCRVSILGALTEALVDPPFLLTRTMGSNGPRLKPEGFEEGRICRVCGVVFFPPQELVEELKSLGMVEDRTKEQLIADGDWVEPGGDGNG